MRSCCQPDRDGPSFLQGRAHRVGTCSVTLGQREGAQRHWKRWSAWCSRRLRQSQCGRPARQVCSRSWHGSDVRSDRTGCIPIRRKRAPGPFARRRLRFVRSRLASGREHAPSSDVDVAGGRCLIDVRSVQLSSAPLAGRESVVTAERRGKGVGRGVAGARGHLRERQLASAGGDLEPASCASRSGTAWVPDRVPAESFAQRLPVTAR